MLQGVFTGLIAMPYSFYLGRKARENPSMRSSYIRRMAILPTVPLVIMIVAGYYSNQNFDYLSNKYFAHLSDADLDNFETYYHMLKSSMPLSPGNIRPPQPYLQQQPYMQQQPPQYGGYPPQPQYYQP